MEFEGGVTTESHHIRVIGLEGNQTNDETSRKDEVDTGKIGVT